MARRILWPVPDEPNRTVCIPSWRSVERSNPVTSPSPELICTGVGCPRRFATGEDPPELDTNAGSTVGDDTLTTQPMSS